MRRLPLALAAFLALTASVAAQVGLPWPGPGTPHSAGGGCASGPYTLIAHTIAMGSSSAVTTSAIDTTCADLIIIALADQVGGSPPTDLKGNTWTALTPQGAGPVGRLFYAKGSGISVGTGHTFSAPGGASTFSTIAVVAFSGSNLTAPFDVETGATNAASNTLQPPTLTPSGNNELLVWMYLSNKNEAYSIDLGLTILDQIPAVPNYGIALAYEIQTTGTARHPTWSEATIGFIDACSAAFK